MSDPNQPSQLSKKDPAWKYAIVAREGDNNCVKCIFCGKLTNGGITRQKQHLIGGFRNAKACDKCPAHVREELKDSLKKKKELKEQINDLLFDQGNQVDEMDTFQDLCDDDVLCSGQAGTSKRSFASSQSSSTSMLKRGSKTKGPLDTYFCPNPEAIVRQRKGQMQKEMDAARKEMRDRTVQVFCRWMYDAGIPFNAVRYESFAAVVEAIGQFGPGMKPPSYHEVRVPFLKKEVNHTKQLLQRHKEDCIKYGCSLMADGWTSRNGKSLINFLVNCPRGTAFVESVDSSSYSKNAMKMFELLSGYIEEMGAHTVVQVITDNASENVLAGKFLMDKYPHLYWTPCAAHCLDLMMEDIFKIQRLKQCFEKAVAVHSFIYGRPRLLDLMRRCTNQRALVKPAKTRFATAFLTLQRFHQQQLNLKKMFTCEEFVLGPYAKEAKAKQAQQTILKQSFWNTVVYALKVGGPLLKVLRLVDGEKRPPMGYIYEAMDRAKEAIAMSFSSPDKYQHIFEIIDRRWEVQLHRPLHAAAHFLNPEFFYNDPNIAKDKEIADGLYACIGRLSKDTEEEDLISNELSIYIRGEGLFGIPPAVRQRKTRAPADWWLAYGQGAPNLQNFAIKVLSLTCSSSGCERNWSIFEFLHSKRRSKMDHGRLKDLVYVKYNRALIRRYNHRDTLDPISLTDIDDANEWLTGKFDDADIEEDTEALIGEDLTWSTVARASGVYERSYNIRQSGKGKQKESSSRSTPITTENEDEEGDEEDEEDEENYSIGDENEGENEALLGCNDDDDDDDELD